MKQIIILSFIIQLLGCSTQSTKTESGNLTPSFSTQDTINENLSDEIKEELKKDFLVEGENWNAYYEAMRIDNYLVKETKQQNPTIVDQNSIVFVSPDSVQIQEIINKVGNNFYTIADDNNYYEYEARQFMIKNRIKSINAKNRYLKFVLSDSNSFLVDTKSPASRGWITFLFKTDSLPKVINPVDIKEEFEEYFKKE